MKLTKENETRGVEIAGYTERNKRCAFVQDKKDPDLSLGHETWAKILCQDLNI